MIREARALYEGGVVSAVAESINISMNAARDGASLRNPSESPGNGAKAVVARMACRTGHVVTAPLHAGAWLRNMACEIVPARLRLGHPEAVQINICLPPSANHAGSERALPHPS